MNSFCISDCSLAKRCRPHDAATDSIRMWSFASNAMAGSLGSRRDLLKPRQANPVCSGDEASPCAGRDEGLECPICWESFDIVDNVPYVLWCGHTLCKNCILGLRWAIVKFPTLPIQLPLFISCPWCQFLSFRLVYRGQLKFPQKNFFLLRMVESLNIEHARRCSAFIRDRQSISNSNGRSSVESSDHHHQCSIRRSPQHLHSDNSQSNAGLTSLIARCWNVANIQLSLQNSLAFLVHLIAKLPLVAIFLFSVVYVIPVGVAILVLHILVTILFGLPSFLMLYFAYPGLERLASAAEIDSFNLIDKYDRKY
ncbi:Ring zinc finger protein-like, partial [Musa troglodytarum]